ncbi:hypothetical protein [Paenibacillus wenxiniae]|uniref:Uncharacterized protein n=1 Tax=Paenibacillus wenxiniae TaxID=1636843 RepID=A0ABW4RCE3_9BACL
MNTTKESNSNSYTFEEDAFYIIGLLKICIEKKEWNESVRIEINQFYETDYEDENPQISKEIASVYMAFLGKTDFKNIESVANEQHLQKLMWELELIENKLGTSY